MGIDRDVWLQALADAGFADADSDPDAITAGEFAATFGMKRTAAADRLDKMVSIGAAVKTKKWAPDGAGRRVLMNAYKLTEKPKGRKAARA